MSQRVVITGGASGIGRRLAERFAARGDRVAICDADGDAVALMQADHPLMIARQADVTNEAQMTAFLGHVEDTWGGADVLCANAGTGGPAGRIEDLDYAAWQACVGVNLFGTFLACRWAARVMRAQGAGLILITTSTSGLHGVPYRTPYVAAKWGLVGLTKTLAMELGPAGVRVNAIAPGAVEGPRMERVVEMEARASGRTEDEVRTLYARGTSLRTWVTADDLADMALFLASPAASKVTGQILAVDGHTESMV
ncbi:3-ketoacyl-(acyl-carrier-protein) reductase [Roseovarius sp. TM1035]|jgi:NAD(P)-dependent dehydrogenase (short-subunit alcohol dehydrogenase family)|uniref:SDR family oxidoreductase n=1 Tax=Roseovarius sp. TM1035 TaxID=391613 RepID=UPI00015577CE|nr:SDR family oxidoreductase [Roseovarius sp. TM1035]EDM32582.1 3-ketoacyl-(acyl-carrier-protein) reductase [Roseovarius sp. TM1035]